MFFEEVFGRFGSVCLPRGKRSVRFGSIRRKLFGKMAIRTRPQNILNNRRRWSAFLKKLQLFDLQVFENALNRRDIAKISGDFSK